MRKPEEMAWYSVEGEDGQPRAMHAIKGKQPKDSKEITAEEAAQISKDVRARAPKPAQAAVQQPAGSPVSVDLTPIQNQLDAHAKMLVEQAHTLDDHETKLTATQASVAEYLQGVKSGKPS